MNHHLHAPVSSARRPLRVTCGPADLTVPVHTPPTYTWRYGNGSIFQVGPCKAGVICNIRFEKLPAGDFEAGMDAVVFDRHESIAARDAVPITRTEKYKHPKTGRPRIRLKHTQKIGFVPRGAKRADGTDHPGAGTGFMLGEALDFPLQADGSYDKTQKTKKMVR